MECLKLDWLGFTFQPVSLDLRLLPIDIFQEVFDFLPFEDCVSCKCRSHYTDCMDLYGIKIFYNYFKFEDMVDDSDKMERLMRLGVNVQISSEKLPLFFKLCNIDFNNNNAVKEMISFLYSRGCKLSRIDLCYDDLEKVFSPWYYIDKWYNKLLQSPFIDTIQPIGSDNKGWTIYFGSLKKREKMLRIYDKYMESCGEIDSVRYEFELHSESANVFGLRLLDDTYSLSFKDFLYTFVRVKDAKSVSNCSRIQDALNDKEWEDWLNAKSQFNAKVLKLSRSGFKSIPSNVNWLHKSVFKSLAGYVSVFGLPSLVHEMQRLIKSGDYNPIYKSFDKYNKYIKKFENDGFTDEVFGCPFEREWFYSLPVLIPEGDSSSPLK